MQTAQIIAPPSLIEPTEKAIVARGTVVLDDGSRVGPGGEVELPVSAIRSLRRSGVLVDPQVGLVIVVHPGVAHVDCLEGAGPRMITTKSWEPLGEEGAGVK